MTDSTNSVRDGAIYWEKIRTRSLTFMVKSKGLISNGAMNIDYSRFAKKRHNPQPLIIIIVW